MLNWVNGRFFPPCCVAWKADSVRAIGGWDERLKKDQDGELMVRALTRGLTVAVSGAGNGVYWQHASEGRLTRAAQIEHITASADIVYEQIVEWLGQGDAPIILPSRLDVTAARWRGSPIRSTVPISPSSGRSEQPTWLLQQGYSHRTSLVAACSACGCRPASRPARVAMRCT